MKILACSIRGGDVCATILAEKEDCMRLGGGHAAVEGCIHRFAGEKGLPSLALARVTRMQETADGGIEFDFDAAVPPQVKVIGMIPMLSKWIVSVAETGFWSSA